ncbi:DUF3349 domain-containing protein [Mycobacterium angelicum]|uniref:DUF3349 domain-containing protein n=1 Tax=Mycobacterium angelicum TaxID=470074 RepID=A0A1W9ZV91_MYCAN|nr:DUF3349 domain-containing protein [Mycobacterium angelicum]MCV7200201.1 DUF3349 domain-containing protein [Mycobacterium angelicum]ORA21702.1 hypothetical protein BST12_11640 [Mycobacterium angelicum]
MALAEWMPKIVAFFRTGYPTGMPITGYVPMVALSRRRLADDEIIKVTEELIAQGCWLIGNADVGVAISRLTQDMPALDDIERVHDRLDTLGCARGRQR